MAKYGLTGLLLVASLLCVSATQGKKAHKYLQGLGFQYIPSGLTMVNGDTLSVNGFYMFEAEISNRQYTDFLKYLQKNQKNAELAIARIDSTGWLSALSFENSYARDYHLDPLYADYPVVNISRQAVELYCSYLEEMIQKKVPEAIVRLPNEIEWMYAAQGGHMEAEFPWSAKATTGMKDIYLCNYNSPDDGTCLATNYAKHYFPNDFGLYNMSGNVAEMLLEQGRTKGGSWKNDALSMRIQASDPYEGFEGASPYIGFRPVVVVKSNHHD